MNKKALENQMNSRKMIFEKIQNVRDLGGLETLDGRRISSGLLLRSANLGEATEADVKKLEEYGLAKVIDLRTVMERQEKPDIIPETVTYLPNPIFDESMLGISHEKETHEKQKQMLIPAMEDLYRMIVTDEVCRRNLGKAAQSVMEHDFAEGSVLWHCTEGKDRCGLLTVILLSALSVERGLIVEDYLLTNEVNAPKAEGYYQQMLAAGKAEAEAEAVKNAFLAKESYLNAAYAAIEEQYGDMDIYLREGLFLSAETISAFRQKVLQ